MNAFVAARKCGALELAEAAILRVVEESFVSHPMRHMTRSEVARRTNLAMRWVNKLYDQGWELDRALHGVREPLLAELDGRRWEPPSRNMYAVNDGIEDLTSQILERERQQSLAG
jgi:hypothetical protein